MLSNDSSSTVDLLDRSSAAQLYRALVHLVDRGRRVDEALLAEADASYPRPQRLRDLMALKRWVTHGLFEIAPRALEANDDRRVEILDLLNSFRESHLRVEARLGERVAEMENDLEASHRADHALSSYAKQQSQRRNLRAA